MQFSEIYKGYTGSHGISKPLGTQNERGKAEHAHFTKPGPPKPQEWEGHLSGKGPGIGIIPLMDDNLSVAWGAIDVDRYPLDHTKLEEEVKGLPLVITKSKSGGAHLWLFINGTAPAKLVHEKLLEWASALGFGNSEIFPKQHHRVTNTDVGNWINLPYYGNTRRAVYRGEEVDLDVFCKLVQARAITVEQLKKIKILTNDQDTGPFSDGPPCLQVITVKGGCDEGGRNNMLFNVGVYLRAKYPENWQEYMLRYNLQVNNPALSEHEVQQTISTVEKKEYNYTCSRDPIKPFCNRALCKKREFGIARNSESSDELNVDLTGLTKVDTTNPRWLINIDGTRADLGDTETLLNQAKFTVICVDRVHKVLNPVTPGKWRQIVQELLQNVEIVQAPLEASPEGQFILYLQEYIEKRKSDSKDSLAQGNVWVEIKEGNKALAYFRSDELFKYLRREGFRDLKMNKIYTLLHEMGMEKGRFNIKGATVAYWCVPLDNLQRAEFDVPDMGDGVFGDGPKK